MLALPRMVRPGARLTTAVLAVSTTITLGLGLVSPASAVDRDKPSAREDSASATAGEGESSADSADSTSVFDAGVLDASDVQLSGAELTLERISDAESVAKAQRGDLYGYGSAGPSRFDCSGLMYYSFRQAGIHLPRTSGGQAGATRRIAKEDMQPGDLMFFANGGGVYHVGMFVGRTPSGAPLMLHSSTYGRPVQIEVPWTSSWFGGTLRKA